MAEPVLAGCGGGGDDDLPGLLPGGSTRGQDAGQVQAGQADQYKHIFNIIIIILEPIFIILYCKNKIISSKFNDSKAYRGLTVRTT